VIDLPHCIYHLALREEWEASVELGAYRRSTIGRSLDDEGFIHCSFASQVQRIADLVFRGRDDVVLLEIDVDLVPVEIRVEQIGDSDEAFPHIYGPLPIDAVARVGQLVLQDDGRLDAEPW
jgi:glutathione S-transferase